MRKGSIRDAVIGVALFASAHSADAHGIAGNRFFVGTLTFDDPSVADEAIVPNFSTLNHPVEGGNAVDNRFDWSFTRLLTPVLQVQVDTGWIHRNWPTPRTSGFATTDVGIKSEIYRNNQHEMLVSAGRSGASGIRERRSSVQTSPILFSPVCFSAKGLAIYLTGLRGYGPSPSPARLWTNCRSARRLLRLASVRRAVRLKACLFLPSKRFTGACPFNTALIT